MADILRRLTTALADRYEFERELGAGGMATVYVARDLRHGREVAIKVLRPELAAVIGAERFLQEIEIAAKLNHPHILPLHDSGQADGLIFYVMPYIEGESLRRRLDREKQLPIDAAVQIAQHVASALDYAHRHGVIHRDIKPENILLQDSQALVADFGIALAIRAAGGERLTETGLSLGTPLYMSPEQATGDRQLDARSDIYSLAAVLYEMLGGQPPYTGPSTQAIIAKLLTEHAPRLRTLRDTVPLPLEQGVMKALAKLPADRFATAAEFADALGRPTTGVGAMAVEAAPLRGAIAAAIASLLEPGRLRLAVPWAVAVLLAVGMLWGWLRARPEPPPPAVVRFALHLPLDVTLAVGSGPNIAMSPDGSRIVFNGRSTAGLQLFVRGLDQLDPVPLPGTENAVGPFFSPDGQWLAFFNGNKLYKLPLAGGPALAVATLPTGSLGGSWGPGDTIAFHSDSALMQVPAAGGDPRVLLRADTSRHEQYLYPEYLPDGRALLFQIRGSNGDHLGALDLRSGTVKRFEQAGSNPRYVSSGHVVLATRTGTLVSLPFDPARLEVTGSAVPLVEGVFVGGSGVAKMGMSRNGAFAYMTGQGGVADLVMVDRGGTARALPVEQRNYLAPRLSPDGRKIAIQVIEPNSPNSDIWIYDIPQRTRTRLTFDQSGARPIWTPDGRRIVFSRGPDGNVDLYWIPADGSGPAESLLVAPDDQWAGAFTPDGRTLVFRAGAGAATKRSLHFLTIGGAPTAQPLLVNQFDNHSPTLSPDGRWVAYVSDESGRVEVYVRPFPGPGGRWQVSLDGGTEPRWSPTGREIFYRNGNRMLAAAVVTQPTFSVGERRELFEGNYLGMGIYPATTSLATGAPFSWCGR